MAIGMTYDQYWYGDPLMVRAFYKAKKIQDGFKDESAWLFGAYVLQALNATVGNMFSKKGSTPMRYPDMPATVKEAQSKRQAKTELEKEQDAIWAKAWMTQFVQAGKNFGKNKG